MTDGYDEASSRVVRSRVVRRVGPLVLRRFATLLSAAAVGGAAMIGAAGLAQADPTCPDVHWIGAAGSGERDGDPSANGGMGRVVNASFKDLQQQLQQDGRTVTAEAVDYPAVAVPADGDLGGWLGFMSSVDTGTAALAGQYAAFTQRCPGSKVVLAGYSQGAMAVHRNLQALAGSPNLTAALLVADGDRLPSDPTVNIGTAAAVPGVGKGVAQDWPILAHAPAPLSTAIGSRTVSVCNVGDAVCDAASDSETVTPAAVAVHTSYAVGKSQGLDWTGPLYQIVAAAPAPVGTPAI